MLTSGFIQGISESLGSDRRTGWAAIEEYVLSHDEDMTSDSSDDIDTMLVFVSETTSCVFLSDSRY